MSSMVKIIRYGFVYGLWAVSVAAAGVIGMIARDVISSALAVSAANAAEKSKSAQFYAGLQLRAAEPWSFMLLGVILIALIGFFEYYYRTGLYQRVLAARFFLITALELGVLTLAHAGRLAISVHLGDAIWPGLLVPLAELAATALFVGLYIWRKPHKVEN